MLLRAVQILKRVRRTLVYYDTDTQNLRILFGSAACTQQRLLQVTRCTSQHTDTSQCTKATLTCCWEQYRSKHIDESKEHLFIMTQTHKISEFWEQCSYVGTSFSRETNNNDRFMAPHLKRAQSTYKDIRICSFYHTHTHMLQIHAWLVTGW